MASLQAHECWLATGSFVLEMLLLIIDAAQGERHGSSART
jgi:hypothetical protein